MGREKDLALEGLIASALDLVSEVETQIPGEQLMALPATAPGQDDVAVALAQAVPAREGYLELSVSPDTMTAEADLHPPQGGAAPLTLEDAQKSLSRAGVTHGILWNAITDALERCNTLRAPRLGVVVARGDAPTDEVPEHISLDPSLLSRLSPPEGEGTVDYRTLSPFHLVKQGQVLGLVVPAEPGKLGTNVRGQTVQHKKRKLERPAVGRNVDIEDGKVVARRDGRFLHAEGFISVSEVLTIPGDVDYATGNIDFPGDVVIQGQVKSGFRVKTGGSLLVSRAISATEVVCGGDLVARQGILGRGSGIVRASGAIHAGFIEHCYVEASKAVHVGVGCLNSAIFTLDRLVASGRGVIAGGSVTAQNGVRAAQIGTESGSRTEIRCGIDFLVNRRLEWIRDRSVALALKLKEIERRAGTRAPNPALEEARGRIRNAIRSLAQTARSLAGMLDRNEGAEIVVTGALYPGTYIEICRVPFIAERVLRSVRLSLSKGQGRIVPHPLR